MMDIKRSAAAALKAAAAFRKKNRRQSRVIAAAVAALLVIVSAAFIAVRPRPVFLVEAEYAGMWKLAAARDGAPGWRTVGFDPAAGPPAFGRRYGYLITTRKDGEPSIAAANEGFSGPPAMYRDLPRTGDVNGALPLAVDPWLVFRRHTEPRLTRERLETTKKGPGVMLLAGGEGEAVWAWTAQELQEKPGSFPQDPGLWRDRADRLPRDGRFQQGALTYTWEDVWSRLFGGETAWVYAPLSRAQAFPGSRTSLLEADRFPEREGWNEYGIQARVLWAVPFGGEAHGERLRSAAEWLKKADTQTYIAEALKWAPAHRAAKPVNPLALAAQREWLGSSFVWEAGLNANRN